MVNYKCASCGTKLDMDLEVLGLTCDDSMFADDIGILVAAAVGTMFFVMTLLSTQDPFAVGAALFVVSSAAFADVNAGVEIGGMLANAIDGNADWAFFGVIGSVVGAFAGWAVKDNCLD